MRAIFTGSFDPVTNGHLDIIRRAASLVDSLVVAVAVNVEKRPMFSDAERVEMLRDVCHEWPHVEVQAFQGLVVEAAKHVHAGVIIRGIRSSAEFDREMHMAQVNRLLAGIETLLLPACPDLGFISSSMIKEIARFSGDIAPFVPSVVFERVHARLHDMNV